MMTPSQCRAARALTEMTRLMLAEASGLDEALISEFESKLADPSDSIVARLQHILESMGAVFIAEDASAGIGVRLKFTRSEAKRISALENEGGIAGDDDLLG